MCDIEDTTTGRRFNSRDLTMPSLGSVLLLPFEFVWLNLKIWFFIFEALFRCIVPPASKDIQENVVLITGGGGGIGRALALEFAKQKARIVVWDINKTAVEETAMLVREQGVTCESYVCDVTNREEVMEVAQDVMRTVGDVDILVNNAGVFPCKTILDLSERDIRRTLDVNTIAIFWTIQAFLPRMMERNSGHLVTISSMAGKHGSPLTTDYTASKFAAFGHMEALRAELRMQGYSGINTSVICPMMVNTGMLHQFQHRITMFDRFGKIYEAPFIAERAVHRIRKNERYIYIPFTHKAVGIINEVLPYKARTAIMDFTQAGFEEKQQSKKES